jgi:hypothetical protein
MVLCPDSQNYLAHERASQRLEMEFGHEPVPGKHAKRDRDKQPEFPRAEANQAEWQQGERTGIDAATRKDQVTALRQASDNAQAFEVALEEQGYILAKGDRRDFVIVDQTGSIHSLGRQIQDIKAAQLREFMKPIDRETLPSAAQAVAFQRQRQQERLRQEPLPPEKTLQPEPKQPEPKQQEPQPQETQKQPKAEPAQKTPPEPAPDSIQAQSEAVRKAVTERQAEERRRLVETQTAELDKLRQELTRETREKLDRFDAIHREQAKDLLREQKEARAGFMDSLQNLFSPARAAEREAERRREQEELAVRQKQARDEYVALLRETNKLEIGNLKERNELHLHDHAVRGEEELSRYIRELEAARKLQAENEERERKLAEERARDGPKRAR